MKKILNGKLYNTKTAELIAEDWYSSPGDFEHWYEGLYRKTTGEFFLYGEGGPLTEYRVFVGQNSVSGGAQIIPFSESAAKSWLEEHASADEYISVFGEIDE